MTHRIFIPTLKSCDCCILYLLFLGKHNRNWQLKRLQRCVLSPLHCESILNFILNGDLMKKSFCHMLVVAGEYLLRPYTKCHSADDFSSRNMLSRASNKVKKLHTHPYCKTKNPSLCFQPAK